MPFFRFIQNPSVKVRLGPPGRPSMASYPGASTRASRVLLDVPTAPTARPHHLTFTPMPLPFLPHLLIQLYLLKNMRNFSVDTDRFIVREGDFADSIVFIWRGTAGASCMGRHAYEARHVITSHARFVYLFLAATSWGSAELKKTVLTAQETKVRDRAQFGHIGSAFLWCLSAHKALLMEEKEEREELERRDALALQRHLQVRVAYDRRACVVHVFVPHGSTHVMISPLHPSPAIAPSQESVLRMLEDPNVRTMRIQGRLLTRGSFPLIRPLSTHI